MKRKKLFDRLCILLTCIAVLLALLLSGARLAGLQVFTVLSGSMEPALPVGALIYVRPVDASTLTPGDVITFLLDERTVATHRITQVLSEGEDLRFVTKGDANTSEDGRPVHFRNIIGTPVFCIPLLGYLSAFLQTPLGTAVAICTGAILLLLAFLPGLLTGRPTKRRNTP